MKNYRNKLTSDKYSIRIYIRKKNGLCLFIIGHLKLIKTFYDQEITVGKRILMSKYKYNLIN